MSGYRSSATALALSAVLLANGCATMHHGRSQVVLVESEPPGARVLVGGEPAGVTPNFVKLDRRDAVITLDRDGFVPREVEVPRSVDGGLVGDILLGGWLFRAAGPWVLAATLGLDLVTGAAWNLAGEVSATLEPEPADVEPADVEPASPVPEGAYGPSRHPRTTEEGQ